MDFDSEVFTNADIRVLERWKMEKILISSQAIRYDWSQTNKFVCITIYKKDVKLNDFFYFIRKAYVLLTIRLSVHEIYNVELVPFAYIRPKLTRIQLSPMKVEVILYKVDRGVKWDDLRYQDNLQLADENDKDPLNPNARKTTEDWNKIVQHIRLEEELEEARSSNLDAFFRKLYDEGDDDTKRAMIKSFQTSRGTVLSTNWKEVQHANYENSANNAEKKKGNN